MKKDPRSVFSQGSVIYGFQDLASPAENAWREGRVCGSDFVPRLQTLSRQKP